MSLAQDQAIDLARRFDLRKHARSWRGDCPGCAYHGSFAIKVSTKAKHPILYCSNGCSREQLTTLAEQALGGTWSPPEPVNPANVAAAREAKLKSARRIWNSARSCVGTGGEDYLIRRGLARFVLSPALRFSSDCWHSSGFRHPALIAHVQDAQGETSGVHRTYLGRGGHKCSLEPSKMSLGPIWGGAIRLNGVASEIVIGEGIETAASAGVLLDLPAWAAISAGNMAAAMALPPEVRQVVIAVDPDPPGRKAAHDAAARWRAEGRQVRLAVPDRAGMDFNDILRGHPYA